MLKIKFIFLLICYIRLSKSEMEPFVVKGRKAYIKQFPHSAFFRVLCKQNHHREPVPYVCGASILTDKIVLTAAHCFFGCHNGKSSISIAVGASNKHKGKVHSVSRYLAHEGFMDGRPNNDIGLARIKTKLRFGPNVKRISLMRNPPYFEKAQLAGWGLITENPEQLADHLMYTNQWVWKRDTCKRVIKLLPRGVLCAASRNGVSHMSNGDSGSALVVRRNIQIGIVSYRMLHISRSIGAYTDTGYYYNWIQKNLKQL